jgi:Holliday junction resolvase-like predicted endonuclease
MGRKTDPSGRKHKRLAAETGGGRAEVLASLVLRCKLYRLLGPRVKTPLGELDLVAMSPSGVLCFMEAKARRRSRGRRVSRPASARPERARPNFT